MQTGWAVKLLGLGHHLPARAVDNAEIEARCGLTPGWVERRTGVRQRRWVAGETSSQMGAAAAREALADAGLSARDVDLVLNASGTQQQAIPDGGPLIQRELGLADSGVPCYSVHATCLSFLVAVQLAAHLIAAGTHRRALIVSADIASCGLDFDHPESAALLGDAAAAAVLGPTPPGEAARLHAARFATFGAGAELTQIRGGGSGRHPNHPDTRPRDNLFEMNGLQVLKLTRQRAAPFLESLRPGLSQGLPGVDWVVPHQASKMGMELMRAYGWPEERTLTTLARYGNCVAASVPLTLHDAVRAGTVRRGDTLLLVGTGAGLSLGGLILTY